MSKETVLKKQFQKRDVERLRNLMKGKYGEKTRSSVGFSKADDFYKEGDVWEEEQLELLRFKITKWRG